jgi:hypothetical protein
MRPGIKDKRENCIMHNRSHLEPKKSICKVQSVQAEERGVGRAHLGLEKAALQQDQRLPLELVNELPQAHAEILVLVSLVIEQAPLLLIRQALLEPAQDFDVGEFSLGKPSLRDDTKALAQHAKGLGTIGDDNNGFLDG